MATATQTLERKIDWPFANPWWWLCGGLALCVWSWIWTLTFGAISSDLRIVFLAVGLLLAGIGACMRFSDRSTTYISDGMPGLAAPLRLGLAVLFFLLALGVSVLFVASFFMGDEIGWRAAPTLLVWLSAAPLCFYAGRRCLKRSEGQPALEADEEIGLALAVGALGTLAGAGTLDLGVAHATEWDSLRLFLRVLTAVGLLAAALVVVSKRVRLLVISWLFVLHFTGIATACLSAPPAPWLVQQTWVRIFRPYLEFMYLNNAYHFYAPEPGPASYFWFRVIYTDERGNDQGWWYKVPDIDDKGRHHHSVALEYQRHLAMTESVAPSEQLPPWLVVNHNPLGMAYVDVGPVFKERLNLQPEMQGPIIGAVGRNVHPRIPLHPLVPQMQQVIIPNETSRRLLSSYARFVSHKFATHPEHKDWTFKSVKLYRVIHAIPTVDWYVNHLSPTDPILYRPYYMGNYDAAGEVLDGKWNKDRDPYLYWLLPIMRTEMSNPNSEVKDYCRLHAGDPNWVRPMGEKNVWQDPRR